MDLLTLTEYAAHAGISKAAVSQAITKGRIPSYDREGNALPADHRGERYVKAAEADRIRGASVRVDPRAEDPVTTTPARHAPAQPGEQDAPASGRGAGAEPNYARARTAVSTMQAQLLRLELEAKKGALLPKEAVLVSFEHAARAIAREMDGLVAIVDELVSVGMAKGTAEARRIMTFRVRELKTSAAEHLSRVARGEPTGGETLVADHGVP